MEEIAWLKEGIADYDLVMLQLELPMEVVEAVAAWAYEAGVPVMLNPAPAAPLSEALLRHVTYLSPNEHEAAAMSGQEIDVNGGINMEDVRKAADYFMRRGVKNLLITFGSNGSVCVNENGVAHTPASLRGQGRGHNRGRRFVCRCILHRLYRGTKRAAGAGLCQPRRRDHGFRHGARCPACPQSQR